MNTKRKKNQQNRELREKREIQNECSNYRLETWLEEMVDFRLRDTQIRCLTTKSMRKHSTR